MTQAGNRTRTCPAPKSRYGGHTLSVQNSKLQDKKPSSKLAERLALGKWKLARARRQRAV